MVAKFVVLLLVEHLEQGGGRVAAEIAPELVDLVQHEDRIARFDAADGLDDAPGQRADIGAAKTANLALVADPTQAHADEAPPQARAMLAPSEVFPRPAARRSRGSTPSRSRRM